MAILVTIFICIFIFTVTPNHESDASASKFIYIDHIRCQFGKVLLAPNATCKLTFITRLKKAFTMRVYLIVGVKTLNIHYTLFYRFRAGYKLFLVDIIDDCCDYLTLGSVKSKVMDFLIPAIKTYSDVNLTCPYVGPWNIEKIPIDGSIFDYPFLPVGDYYLNISLYNKHLMLSLQFYFTVPSGKTIEDDAMGR